MNPLTGLFSPATRKRLYTLYALVGLAVGAVQVWCASTAADQPSWINGALAVLAYVGAALGFTAASNVPTPDTDEEGGEGGSTLIDLCAVVATVSLLLLALHALGKVG